MNSAKKVTIGAFKWKHLLRKGGLLLHSWLLIVPPLLNQIVSPIKCKAIRDKLLALLKGSFPLSVDPPLPIPKMVRDEFNAYKKSTLQEYLYELLFKEGEQTSTASTAASLMELPPLLLEEEEPCELDMEEFELNIEELIGEVAYGMTLVQGELRETMSFRPPLVPNSFSRPALRLPAQSLRKIHPIRHHSRGGAGDVESVGLAVDGGETSARHAADNFLLLPSLQQVRAALQGRAGLDQRVLHARTFGNDCSGPAIVPLWWSWIKCLKGLPRL